MDDKKQKANRQSTIVNRKSHRLYSFPTVVRCPRCGKTDTKVTSTQKNVQYRICLVPICRKRFPVLGTKVTETKKGKDPRDVKKDKSKESKEKTENK